ncbi:hypothetical protein Tco_0492994 [Tanacetum coccineum]|uniref:Uncharacterized protein n=1 Tax=Tanacetum coccineum TaxID=301880 RepID=A0ABQ4WM05_9ASTR
MFEEDESSSTDEDPSNFHVITPVQPLTYVWTKAYPLDQVIGDPSSYEHYRAEEHQRSYGGRSQLDRVYARRAASISETRHMGIGSMTYR